MAAEVKSKYLLDYEEYIKERPDEVEEAWKGRYEENMKQADLSMYNFIMSYIFM
jgi:hypothetical protein